MFYQTKKRIRTYYGLNSPKINSKTTKEPYLNHKSHTMHLKDHNDVGDNFLILVTFFIIFDKPSAKPFCHQNSNIVANMKSSKSQWWDCCLRRTSNLKNCLGVRGRGRRRRWRPLEAWFWFAIFTLTHLSERFFCKMSEFSDNIKPCFLFKNHFRADVKCSLNSLNISKYLKIFYNDLWFLLQPTSISQPYICSFFFFFWRPISDFFGPL